MAVASPCPQVFQRREARIRSDEQAFGEQMADRVAPARILQHAEILRKIGHLNLLSKPRAVRSDSQYEAQASDTIAPLGDYEED